MPDYTPLFAALGFLVPILTATYFLGYRHGFSRGYDALPEKERRAARVDASLRQSAKRASKTLRKSSKAARTL